MKSLQRMFSWRKGVEDLKEFFPNESDSNMHESKAKSFWKRISPKSVTYISESSNRSGEESRPQSPPPIIDSPIDISMRRISHKSHSLDSLDLRHDVPRIKLHEHQLSPEVMGMIRYEDNDGKDNNQQQYPVPASPPYLEINQPSAAIEQPQYQNQNSFKDYGKNSDVFLMASQNPSDSLGIKYIDADDFSSVKEEENNKQLESVPSHNQQRNVNNPPLAARKSSHNISQHAIDALLGTSAESQDPQPAQQLQHYQGSRNSFQQSKTTKTKASENDIPNFAISSDKESELDMYPQRLFDICPINENSFINSNAKQINNNISSDDNNNNNKHSSPYESIRPMSVDVRHSCGSINNLNLARSPEKKRCSATRRIASLSTSRPPSEDSTSSSMTQTMTLQQPMQDTTSTHQTVPFDGPVPRESPPSTERSMIFPPKVSLLQQQERNPSPQHLPSKRLQSSHHSQPASSSASVATAKSSSNVRHVRPQVTRQGSASRRPSVAFLTELVGPGVISVPPMQRQQSLGQRRSQMDQDNFNARRCSMPPSVTANINGAIRGNDKRLSLQGHHNLASQSQYQSQYGNMNLSSMSVGNHTFAGSSMALPLNASNPSNILGISTMPINNRVLQQAILQLQQMHHQQQQQLQQLQQQQQQLHIMTAMGMATVPMVAANGMVYQQPIMTIMQNNVIAINSLTNSLTATAASLALISASATPVSTTPAAILHVVPAATSLLTSSFQNNATSKYIFDGTNWEEQLLNRQRQVERENDMQLHMAIEQSLQETYHHQPSQQTVTMISNNNSTAPSRFMSPASNHAHRRTSTNNSNYNNRSHIQPSTLVGDDANDGALQLALMMSLEEQLHEQQSAYQQIAQYEQQNHHIHNNNYQARSHSPPIREQQRALLSRQTSHRASRDLRAPSRAAPSRSMSPANNHRHTFNLQERQSRSESHEVTTGQQHQNCAPLSHPLSGVTSRAVSNHSSFHEDHHPSVASPSYQEVANHPHPLLLPSDSTAIENYSHKNSNNIHMYTYDATAPPGCTACPLSSPAYQELEPEPKEYTAKTLVRHSVSTDHSQGGSI